MQLISPRRQILRSIGFVVLIIVLIVLMVDFDAMWEAVLLTDWGEYFLGVCFLLVMYSLYSLRSRFLLQQKFSYFDTMSMDVTGLMFAVLMQIPKDAFRVLAWNRTDKVDASLTASALTIGGITSWLVRMLGLIFALVLAAANSGDAERPLFTSLVTVVGLLLLLMLIAKNSARIQSPLAKGFSFLPRVTPARAEKIALNITHTLEHIASVRRFGMVLFLTILVWVFALLFYFYSFESMNMEITKSHLLVALAVMVVAPPTSPMMIGVFNGAVIAVLGTMRLLNPDDAAVYSIALHLTQMILLVIMGTIGMRRLKLEFRVIIKEIRASTHKQK